MLGEYLQHLSKVKQILADLKTDDFTVVELSSLITPTPSLENNAFGGGTLTKVKKSIGLREAHDSVKSFKRINNFYDYERLDYYLAARDEFEEYERQWDFHRARVEQLVR